MGSVVFHCNNIAWWWW